MFTSNYVEIRGEMGMIDSLQELRFPVDGYGIRCEWQTVAAAYLHRVTLREESHAAQASLLVLQECGTHDVRQDSMNLPSIMRADSAVPIRISCRSSSFPAPFMTCPIYVRLPREKPENRPFLTRPSKPPYATATNIHFNIWH